MNVLSLFDGMSCGRLALERAGITVDKYFASEIDRYAIRVTQANYPDTIQLGDVREVRAPQLPKIDLLIAGSPCQGFSKAGNGLNFEDERSKLFFEFTRLLKECREANPDLLFLLENVDMLQEWQDIISKEVGIQPIKINSALVSAQNRVRLYWTNIGTNLDMFGNLIPGIPQPKDRNIILKDILEEEVHERYYLSGKAIEALKTRHENFRARINPHKTGTIFSGNQSGKNTDNGTTYITHSRHSRGCGNDVQEPIYKQDQKAYCLDVRSDINGGTINNFEFKANKANKANNIDANYFKGRDNHGARTVILYTGSQAGCVYTTNGKSSSINSQGGGQGAVSGLYKIKPNQIRRLTPIECSRLQGVPDSYLYHPQLTHGVGKALSDTQRYKMLGNGWQVDTIVHIFSYL